MSDSTRQSSTTRREFLATGARTLLLGGLVGFFVHQRLRARDLEGDPSCIKLHTCSDCIELTSGCRLPKANSFRESRAADHADSVAKPGATRSS